MVPPVVYAPEPSEPSSTRVVLLRTVTVHEPFAPVLPSTSRTVTASPVAKPCSPSVVIATGAVLVAATISVSVEARKFAAYEIEASTATSAAQPISRERGTSVRRPSTTAPIEPR